MVTSSRSESRTAWKPTSACIIATSSSRGSVALDVERRDDDVQVRLELLVRAEHQPAHP